MVTNLDHLPTNLPIPVDDGACAHLASSTLPNVTLSSTSGNSVNLSNLQGGWVVYIYPMTGHPDIALPDSWDDIPGARGCTPQACSFRDHHSELKTLGVGVIGLSSQTTEYQCEAKKRLHLPFELLSDNFLLLKEKMRLPTFTVAGMELYRRLTLIMKDGKIEKIFYPVFPPDQNAAEVLSWLKNGDLRSP